MPATRSRTIVLGKMHDVRPHALVVSCVREAGMRAEHVCVMPRRALRLCDVRVAEPSVSFLPLCPLLYSIRASLSAPTQFRFPNNLCVHDSWSEIQIFNLALFLFFFLS